MQFMAASKCVGQMPPPNSPCAAQSGVRIREIGTTTHGAIGITYLRGLTHAKICIALLIHKG